MDSLNPVPKPSAEPPPPTEFTDPKKYLPQFAVSTAIVFFSFFAGMEWELRWTRPGLPLPFLGEIWTAIVLLIALFGRRKIIPGIMLYGGLACIVPFVLSRHLAYLATFGMLFTAFLFSGGWWRNQDLVPVAAREVLRRIFGQQD